VETIPGAGLERTFFRIKRSSAVRKPQPPPFQVGLEKYAYLDVKLA